MLRILFVNHVSEISGAEKVLLNLADYLNREVVCPIFVCPGKGKLADALESRNFPVKLIPMPLLVRMYNS